LPTPHPKLRIAGAGEAPGETWLTEVETWLSQPRAPADEEVKRELGRRVPGYQSAAAEGGVREIQEKG
jgi:hypothetical protein